MIQAPAATNLRIVMAQLDFLVGDIDGNADRIIAACRTAHTEHAADVIVFPELALTGYPPEDLLLRTHFIDEVDAALARLCREISDVIAIAGYPLRRDGALYNAAAVIQGGAVVARYEKQHLPNYSVFDEKRYFSQGNATAVVNIRDVPVGITICEDIWAPGPARATAAAGARLLVNINASPFHAGKGSERELLLAQRARESGIPIVYVNLVGGQDELVFDGGSLVVDESGNVVQRAPACMEGLYPVDFHVGEAVTPVAGAVTPQLQAVEAVYQVLVTGVRDYLAKNGFQGAVIGLSGGIDSALTLAIAVDAIGADRVQAVMMPSRYTAAMSLEDA
ncbi:MAG: nitrilase-related carbon-nitrogen hydrolase, partial [Gammaproteobacteria bacterium]